MEKLFYLVTWDKKDKTRTWSGTCWGLYQALQHFFNVEDINIKSNESSLWYKILRKIWFLKPDMGCKKILKNRKHLLPFFLKQKNPVKVFQFEEYIPTQGNVSTYIYQDLSVSYVKYMQMHLPEVFALSGFNCFDKKTIEQKLTLEVANQKTCSALFCMGEWLKQDCIDRTGLSPEKVYAVGGGINLDKNKIKDTSLRSNNKILFVGRDFKRKGGYLVYDAFVLLKHSIPEAELYIAGPTKDPIRNPIEGYHYLGDCNHDILSDYFNRCDIFCMPSYFEAYGLAFIEALTYGLPCIGRNCYEMPYFIQNGETGLLLDKDDPQLLASMMQRLLSDERIKNNVLAKREWYIANYSWDAVATRIANIINSSVN